MDLGKEKYLNHLMGREEYSKRTLKVINFIQDNYWIFNHFFDNICDDIGEIIKNLTLFSYQYPVNLNFRCKDSKEIIKETKDLFEKFENTKVKNPISNVHTYHYMTYPNGLVDEKKDELYGEIQKVKKERYEMYVLIYDLIGFLSNNISYTINEKNSEFRELLNSVCVRMRMRMMECEYALSVVEMTRNQERAKENLMTSVFFLNSYHQRQLIDFLLCVGKENKKMIKFII